MKKILGIFGLLAFVILATAIMTDAFLTPYNLENLIRRTSLFGIISVGVAFVIITGGIDLSIGSVICLIGCGLPFLLQVSYEPAQEARAQEINATQGTVTLATPAAFESGDMVRLFNSEPDNTGVYRVKSTVGNVLTLDPEPPVADGRGTLVKVQAIRDHAEGVTLEGVPPNARDQVMFIKQDGTAGSTERVESVKDNRLQLARGPPAEATHVVILHRHQRTSVPVALALVFLVSLAIGLSHGYLVAKLRLQPFVVTLCGLLLYRGITRGFTKDQAQGFGDEYPLLRTIATAKLGQLDFAQALGLMGGLLLLAGVGWFLWQWLRPSATRSTSPLWALLPILAGIGLAVGGLWQAWHVPVIQERITNEKNLPVIEIPTEGNQTLALDLPAGTLKFALEAQDADGNWTALASRDFNSSTDIFQANVPPLNIIRAKTNQEWQAARINVLAQEHHVPLPAGAREVIVEVLNVDGNWAPLGEPVAIDPQRQPPMHTIPSLATLRAQDGGDPQELRLKVTDRELPRIGIPAPCLILLIVSVAAGIFLNHTIHGRYLLALGRNEEAAKYSGINTERMLILAYVICSLLAGLGGMLFVMDVNSAQPVDFGNFYELYAIAAAVLGGCSLRGGEGTILGVVIGACLMRVLKNMITLVDEIPTHIEFAIIGAVILAGVTVDELIKRYAARRRAARQQEGE